MELFKKVSFIKSILFALFPPISKRFYAYLISRFVTLIGARCIFMTLVWWNLEKTDTILNISILFFTYELFGVIGRLALAPLGDFISKKLLIEVSYITGFIGCIFISSQIISNNTNMILLSVPLIFQGLMEGMRDPICSSLIPNLVNDGEIYNGTRIRNIFDSLARLSGPGVASILIFYKGFRYTLLCGLFFMLATIIIVPFIKFGERQSNGIKISVKKYLLGFRILVKLKPEMQIATISMIINFSVVPFLAIATPAIIKKSGFSSLYLGVVEILFGIGIIIGSSPFCSFLNKLIGKYQTTLAGLMSISLMLALPLLNNFSSFSLPAALLLGGIGLSLFNINVNALRLIATPEIYLSRLISIVATVCTITIPFGTIILGGVCQKVGLNLTFSVLGFSLFLITTIYFIYFGDLKHVFSQNETILKEYYMNEWPEAFR